jgi:flagellar motor component MotA
MKKLLLLAPLFCVFNLSIAQIVISPTTPIVSVNTQQKKEVETFKANEANQIKAHRALMRQKRQLLNEKEKQLLEEVTEAKKQGSLSVEQKESFKARHLDIKNEVQNLSNINNEFLKKIHTQREELHAKYPSVK